MRRRQSDKSKEQRAKCAARTWFFRKGIYRCSSYRFALSPMLLVIDNYDSFTYNLVQYLGELGEEIVVRRNNETTVAEIESELRPERIVISPGPGTPDQAGVSLNVIRNLGGKVPLLGVCLGHQSLGQAFGGRV